MKIVFIVSEFPVLPETFILNQIIGLMERHHEVSIFADSRGDDPKVHPDIEKYNILSRVYYRNIPVNKLWRFIRAIGFIIANFHKNPLAILKSLNFFKYGKDAFSLKLLYAVIFFFGKKSYDIIHCHFGPNGSLAVLLREIGVINSKIITTFYGYDVGSYVRNHGKNCYKSLFEGGD